MHVLVVDDDVTLRMLVRTALETRDYTVEEAEDGAQAVEMFKNGSFNAVVLDVNMPKMSGMEALEKIKEHDPSAFCLILTAYADLQDAIKSVKLGAFDYIEKPVDMDRLFEAFDGGAKANSLIEAAAFSAPQLNFDEGRQIIGGSSSIRKVFDVIYKLSKVDTSVLIRGESGTGKELVARALHFNSHRKKGPFVAVNCAAIPENLIESELFGHEKGAFTGADKKKLGKFQFAQGGTIFLDEIGDISAQLQVKLLRVLQEKVITPVGSNQEVKMDVRVIAATNRPLEKMIEKDTFRADLFYRLNVLPINLPPLRDRKEDIGPLAEYMRRKFNGVHGREIKGFDDGALNAMRNYSWPGNIRELENVVEHCFIIESTDVIQLASLPDHIVSQNIARGNSGAGQATTGPATNATVSDVVFEGSELNFPALKEKFEREFLIRALKAFNGRVNQTAENTKMTKVTLLRKLEKYGISAKDYHNRQ